MQALSYARFSVSDFFICGISKQYWGVFQDCHKLSEIELLQK